MKKKCIEAVERAIGRTLSKEEVAAYDNRILEALDEFRRAKPKDYAVMSSQERLRAAADYAEEKHLADAALIRKRKMLSITANAKLKAAFNEELKRADTGAKAVGAVLKKINVYTLGVAPEYMSKAIVAMHAAHPRFFGLIENPEAVKLFATEVLSKADGSSGSKEMQAAAKAWLETIEEMRIRFNGDGGNIGKLDYGYLPTLHESTRIRNIGKDQWVNKVLGWLNRDRYINLDGSLMSDADVVTQILEPAYITITTGGINKREPGQFQGGGMRANRGSEHRVLHWKDADSYVAYNREFGKTSTFAAMAQHIQSLGRDIGLIEAMGPNPNHAFQVLNDIAKKQDGGLTKFAMRPVTAKQIYDVMSGEANMVEHQRFAEVSQAMRNYTTAAKLVGTAITSIADFATYFATTGYYGIGTVKAFTNLVQSMGKESRDFANVVGLATEGIIADMGHYMDTMLMETRMGKTTSFIADVTMRAQLLNMYTRWIRRAASTLLMSRLSEFSQQEWKALNKYDRARLEAKGVTEKDFSIWKMAELEDWRGAKMLTPESIRSISDEKFVAAGLDPVKTKDEAVSRLLGVITDEAHFASISPDIQARAITTGAARRGTLWGEIARTITLFKGFTISMMTRHLDRLINDPMSPASRLQYAATLIVGGTILGGVVTQLNQLRDGKDPLNMNPVEGEHGAKFWVKAAATGGGLGFAGDLVYQASVGGSQGGISTASNVASSLLGPVFGVGLEATDITLGNLGKALSGDDTKMAAEAVRFAYHNTPFIRLWYAKNVVDHAIMNDLMEAASPGYLARTQKRAMKGWGQDYYQDPTEMLPKRFPNLEAMIGQ